MSYNLFTYPQSPGYRKTDTSKAAAESIAPKQGTLKALVLDALEQNPNGLTSEEIAVRIGKKYSSVQPRTSELLVDKLIKDSGKRRPSEDKKQIIVWQVNHGEDK